MVKRLLVVTSLLVLAVAAEAAACSCAGGSAKQRLAESELVFVGVVASRADGARETLYDFDVVRTFKGRPPARLRMRTSRDEASCGFDARIGDRLAFALHDPTPDAEGVYSGGLCSIVDEAETEKAATPFPSPAGTGRAHLLVAGAFGDAGLVAYDRDGRLLAYGFGVRGRTLDVCPGGRFAIVAADDLHVLRLRDLARVRRVPLPGDDVSAARCLSSRGTGVAAATFRHGTDNRTTLVRVDRDRRRTLARGGEGSPAIGRRFAYLPDGRERFRIRRIDLRTGQERVVLRGAGQPQDLAVSPGERRLAVLHPGSGRATLLDLRSSRARSRRTRSHEGTPAWLDDRRLAVGNAVIDAVSGRVLRLPRVLRGRLAAEPGRVYGLGFDRRLRMARPGDVRARTLAALPDAALAGLAVIPGGIALDGASDRAASPLGSPDDAQPRSQARSASPCSSSAGGGRRTGGR